MLCADAPLKNDHFPAARWNNTTASRKKGVENENESYWFENIFNSYKTKADVYQVGKRKASAKI